MPADPPARSALVTGASRGIGAAVARQVAPGQAAYAAAKAGLEALTRAGAVEVARRGVTVNAVAPGFVTTDMLAASGAETGGVPAQRPGTPDEVAACVCFLTTPEAAYVNGATLVVAGGLSAAMAR